MAEHCLLGVVLSVNPDRTGDRCPRCDECGDGRVVPTIDKCPNRSFHVHQDEVQELRVAAQPEKAVHFPRHQHSRLEMQLRVQQSNVGGVPWVSAWTSWVSGINVDEVRAQLQDLTVQPCEVHGDQARSTITVAASELRQMMKNLRVLRLHDANTNDMVWLFTFQSTSVPGGVCTATPGGRMEFPRLEARLRVRGGRERRLLSSSSHTSNSGSGSSHGSSSSSSGYGGGGESGGGGDTVATVLSCYQRAAVECARCKCWRPDCELSTDDIPVCAPGEWLSNCTYISVCRAKKAGSVTVGIFESHMQPFRVDDKGSVERHHHGMPLKICT